ncbi:methyltransferase domain-containing protein [uncultured Albimonas sp.]|uniref:class I SAM-dependent methyltransferase n=1 Tax=uncultured Albimonas sp. TaxID=1331701 RepID=UPI0030EB1E2F|tara:strand:+ start:8468 stop:9343 length:876 start_codon:yes stop_codon:yes gene_type:complete
MGWRNNDATETVPSKGRGAGKRNGGGGKGRGQGQGGKGRGKGGGKGQGGGKGRGPVEAAPMAPPPPGFFSNHPRFAETSDVASDLQRLDFRHRLIIEANADLLTGKRVLDLACHDGRFSYAALEAGAAHVTGIEARADHTEAARENLRFHQVDESRWRFLEGDMFERIGEIEPGSIDTVMVLGFLYHTARQYELFAAISALGASAVILDSAILPRKKRAMVQLRWEKTGGPAQIWDGKRPQALSSIPSEPALAAWLTEFGWTPAFVEPPQPIPDSAGQYRKGKRIAMRGVR